MLKQYMKCVLVVVLHGHKVFLLLHRQHLTPCEAELTLSGYEKIRSTASNYWLGHMIQRTNHIFTGGLPLRYLPNQVRRLQSGFISACTLKIHITLM